MLIIYVSISFRALVYTVHVVTKILLMSADAESWKILKQSINMFNREECDTKNEEICDTIREVSEFRALVYTVHVITWI